MTNKYLELNKTYTFNELCETMGEQPQEGKRLTQLGEIRKYCKLKSQGLNSYKVVEIKVDEEEQRIEQLKETIKDMPWITMTDDGTLNFEPYSQKIINGECDGTIDDIF